MKNIKEIKVGKNIASVYNCAKCNKKLRDCRYDDFKIEKYNYCPYCGVELNWGE